MKRLGGSKSDKWNKNLIDQAIDSLWLKHGDEVELERQAGAVAAALAGIAPKDELEGMIGAQLIGAHNAAMECYRRAMIPDQSFAGRRENLNQANKLSHTYAALLEALNRHRGKGQQKVTVEHVHVHAGGQAVVGMVETPGGGYQSKLEDQPHAKQIAHAPQPPMWSTNAEIRAKHRQCRTVVAGCTAESHRAFHNNALKHGRYTAEAITRASDASSSRPRLRTLRAWLA